MKLGLLGPADGDLEALARAAEFLLNGVKVDRAVYLGNDGAIEDVVALWAASLVGDDPTQRGVWARARDVAIGGSPAEIDAFLDAERARLRLRALEALPSEGLRSVEMFGDRVAVLIHDKSLLDEEDIFSATFLVYGRSATPLAKKIGTRWFLTPGALGSAEGGALVLDDTGDEVTGSIYARDGRRTFHQTLAGARGARMRVQGSG